MSELLMPELLWQTLAWSVLLVVLAILALRRSASYAKQALGLFFSGLIASYAMSLFVDWRSPVLSTITLYVTLFVSFAVFAIGCSFLYEFFKRHSVAIKPEASRPLAWIGGSLRKKRAVWLCGITGLAVGILEPVQLSQYHFDQRYLLIEQTGPGHISALLHTIFVTLLPMALIVLVAGAVYLALSRKQGDHPHNHHLIAGHSYIILGWLLLAITAGFLRI